MSKEMRTGFDDILGRLMEATGTKTQTQFADVLEIRQGSVGKAKTRGKIPPGWIVDIALRYSVSADWLLTGAGAKTLDKSNQKLDVAELDKDALLSAIQALEEWLHENNKKLTPDKKAEVIMLLYEEAIETQESKEKAGTPRTLRLLKAVV